MITGVTGQDGSYRARLLLSKGYVVHGVRRRRASADNERITDLIDAPSFYVHHGDMLDYSSLVALMWAVMPDEVYHLVAQSHVQVSFEQPDYTANVNALAHAGCSELCGK